LNRNRIRVSREVWEFQIWNTYSTRNRMRWSHEHRKRTANRTNWGSVLTRVKIDNVLFDANNFKYRLTEGSMSLHCRQVKRPNHKLYWWQILQLCRLLQARMC